MRLCADVWKGWKKGETKTPKRGGAYPVSLKVCHAGWARIEQIIINKKIKTAYKDKSCNNIFEEYDQNIHSTLRLRTPGVGPCRFSVILL